uniref:Dynamin n=1 Tax=Cyanidioschyzon merolae TaxID=45157 RepID=UPI000E20C8AA|nr:Chain A, Dynamin [Cyanidioschyzon merolae]
MERLIPIVNKLQDLFAETGLDSPIDLPQIMVVGAQSSGKSSVLENVVGESIFPRGTGIVTRRPIVVQLYCTARERLNQSGAPDNMFNEDGSYVLSDGAPTDPRSIPPGAENQAYAEFLHKPGVRFYNFDDVRAEIERETDRVTGKNKGISPKAINLRVYSPHVVNLTVVDLPGLTKVPVGDQPSDIERLIRAMVLSYIERPNAIILAVHPATMDLATSDALQIARQADPEGRRTLGVITKLDLMDKGTDAMEMLTGKVIPLKLGYIGVICRGPADLRAGKSIQQAREDEIRFFRSHPVYRRLLPQLGTNTLARTLSTLLMKHIRDTLPSIRQKMSQQLAEWRKELQTLGPAFEGADDLGGALLNVINRYSSEFAKSLEGNSQQTVNTQELYGGARINYIFNDIYAKELQSMNAFEGLTREDIRTAIRNATGHRSPLFVPELAFELLVKKQITHFVPPAYSCVDLVYDELVRLALNCETELLQRYENLRSEILACAQNLLRELKQPCLEMVQNLIAMETSYISVNHKDFIGGNKAMSQLVRARMEEEERRTRSAKAANSTDNAANSAPKESNANDNRILQPRRRNQDENAKKNDDARRKDDKSPNKTDASNAEKDARSDRNPRGDPTMDNFFNEADEDEEDGNERRNRGLHTLPSVPEHLKAGEVSSDRDRDDIELIQTLLASYFDVVRVNMMDMVPKAIMSFLVLRARDRMQSRLVADLYKPERMSELLNESSDVAERRATAKRMVDLLQRGMAVINEVRDVHVKEEIHHHHHH